MYILLVVQNENINNGNYLIMKTISGAVFASGPSEHCFYIYINLFILGLHLFQMVVLFCLLHILNFLFKYIFYKLVVLCS